MNKPLSAPARRDLRQRMVEDMNVRGFSAKTQHDYRRIVSHFAAFLGRSPDSAAAEDLRRFQIEQREAGMPAPVMNSHVAALRFFFTTTIDRPDLSRKLIRVSYPRTKASAKTGSSASIVANRSINGSKRTSGMVGINA